MTDFIIFTNGDDTFRVPANSVKEAINEYYIYQHGSGGYCDNFLKLLDCIPESDVMLMVDTFNMFNERYGFEEIREIVTVGKVIYCE